MALQESVLEWQNVTIRADPPARWTQSKKHLLAYNLLVVTATMASGQATIEIAHSLATWGAPPLSHIRGFLGDRTLRHNPQPVHFSKNKPFQWKRFKNCLLDKPYIVSIAANLPRGEFIVVTDAMKGDANIRTGELYIPRMLVLDDGSTQFLLSGEKTPLEYLNHLLVEVSGGRLSNESESVHP